MSAPACEAVTLSGGSATLTIPSGTNAVAVFWGYWNAANGNGLASATLNGNAATHSQETATVAAQEEGATGVLIWEGSISGSITLAMSFDAATTEGPAILAVYLSDYGTYKTAGSAAGQATNAVSVTLSSLATTDIAIMSDARDSGTAPGVPAGWSTPTGTATTLTNLYGMRASYKTTGATSQVCDAQTTRSYSLVAAFAYAPAAGGNTMPAASGSYSLTGAAAVPRHGRTMPATAASFALSGTAAVPRHGRTMPAAATSLALTGAAVTLTPGGGGGPTHTMPADFGTLDIAGADAALYHGRLLTASSGSVALTGTVAALRASRKMAAATASFALTGAAAALSLAHVLVAGAASFVLTGAAAALKASRKMAAAAASFALTGAAATLTPGGAGTHTLPADAAAFSLTGAAAALKKASKLVASTTAFALSGTAATLTRAHVMTASTASFALSGATAAFRAARALAAQAALFIVSGAVATLAYFQSNAVYFAPWVQELARAVMAAIADTTLTIDLGGAGETAGVPAFRAGRSFDPRIGARGIMSSQTVFRVETRTAPSSLAPNVIIRDETNLQQFEVYKVTNGRDGLTEIEVKNR